MHVSRFRPRFTLRRLMVVVANGALTLGLRRWMIDRSENLCFYGNGSSLRFRL